MAYFFQYISKSNFIGTYVSKALLLIILTLSFSCSSTQGRVDVDLTSVVLEKHGITIYYPDDWYSFDDKYFHFKAIGIAPNHLPAFIEYKSTLAKGVENMDLYAAAWYLAQQENYPEWQYTSQDKKVDEGEILYMFEGTYRVGPDVFRKIGKLRFIKGRIHAIYYTGLDIEFLHVRDLFDEMDSRLEYHDPVEE